MVIDEPALGSGRIKRFVCLHLHFKMQTYEPMLSDIPSTSLHFRLRTSALPKQVNCHHDAVTYRAQGHDADNDFSSFTVAAVSLGKV